MKRIKKILIPLVVFLASIFTGKCNLKVSGTEIKVNLGCGLRCLPNWINIDGSLTALFSSKRFSFLNKLLYHLAGSSEYYSFEEFDTIIKKNKLHFYDLRKGIPLLTGSIDVLYTSHFLEHINKNDAKNFIKECYRVLKPGGLLRVVVPDLDMAFKMYKEGKAEEMLDSFFYTSDIYDFHMHKYNYNFKTLGILLKNAGFSDIQKKSYQKGKCPDINFLDIYPEHSLYVEAKK